MAGQAIDKDNHTGGKKAIWIIATLLIIVLAVVLTLTIKNDNNQKAILGESIEQQLIATSIAAKDLLDVELIDDINSPADIAQNQESYDQSLARLKLLRAEVGAIYIYVLKLIDGKAYFIFDTDEENPETFGDPYQLSVVHDRAFDGEINASIFNVSDQWGSFNTGAAPIYKNGKVIAIVSTDIEDAYLQRSIDTTNLNITILVITLVVILAILLIVIAIMFRRESKMQKNLFRVANFDNITSLPNRNYLFNYLAQINNDAQINNNPYALMFIDLDNFKSVNDGAGHDAGDALLRQIAKFLENSREDSRTFRPDAGVLDFSARIGGDEFLQILPGVGTNEVAAVVAQQMLDSFSNQPELQPFIQKFSVGLSIGVALFPQNSTDYNVLIKLADVAMYHAKEAGKNQYAIYNSDMDKNLDKFDLTVRKIRPAAS